MALSSTTPKRRPDGLEDFLAIPPAERFHEILEGALVKKTLPSFRHGAVQGRLRAQLDSYDASSLRPQPGGWWIVSEVEVLLFGKQVVRPDLCAWRCERMPEAPSQFPVPLRPDWICEVVSPSDPRRDTVIKYRDYARAGIPYYWLADLQEQSLTALSLNGEHYTVQAEARAGQPLRFAEPFELIEIALEALFRGLPATPVVE